MPKLKVPAVKKNLDKMIDFVTDGLNELDIKEKDKYISKIRLACEEALVNIISYAYEEEIGQVEIAYSYNEANNEFKIELTDAGTAFNPLEKPDPDTSLPLEEREIGGLGIFMIKKIMDKVSYKREDGKNTLKMIKILNSEA
ncbi:MAG: ATP-binding protein [Bacillota bacterium]